MLKLNGIDFELPTMTKDPAPLIGFDEEFETKIAISGKELHRIMGRRYIAEFGFAYLTDSQILSLSGILESFKQQGFIYVESSTNGGNIALNCSIIVDNLQSRFKKVGDQYVWTNYQIKLRGIELI